MCDIPLTAKWPGILYIQRHFVFRLTEINTKSLRKKGRLRGIVPQKLKHKLLELDIFWAISPLLRVQINTEYKIFIECIPNPLRTITNLNIGQRLCMP